MIDVHVQAARPWFFIDQLIDRRQERRRKNDEMTVLLALPSSNLIHQTAFSCVII